MADRRAGRGRARDEGPEGWSFRGSAHYQFHLVRSSVARQFVPPDLPLVELAGYTLGGFYYANYADSPAGRMDELVVLSGLVWNAPTSCAWASHVFVDRRSAVSHGRRVFGLPSRLSTIRQRRAVQGGGEVVAVESGGGPIVELRRKARPSALKGPKISFQLPSFSGRTKHKPDLLKYDLDLSATIQPCAGYEVSLPASRGSSKAGSALAAQVGSILSGKMLASLSFKNMSMHVKRPEVFAKNEKKGSTPIGVPKRRRAGSAKISSVQT